MTLRPWSPSRSNSEQQSALSLFLCVEWKNILLPSAFWKNLTRKGGEGKLPRTSGDVFFFFSLLKAGRIKLSMIQIQALLMYKTIILQDTWPGLLLLILPSVFSHIYDDMQEEEQQQCCTYDVEAQQRRLVALWEWKMQQFNAQTCSVMLVCQLICTIKSLLSCWQLHTCFVFSQSYTVLFPERCRINAAYWWKTNSENNSRALTWK